VGGRKTEVEQQPQLLNNFLAILAEFTAGEPMREGVLWTNLSRYEISRRVLERGSSASRHTVRKLLRKHGLGQRKARKKKSMGAHPDRNRPVVVATWQSSLSQGVAVINLV